MSNEEKKPIIPVPPAAPIIMQKPHKASVSAATRSIRATCAWVVIISAAMFAFVAVLGIWGVFGVSTGDVVGKSLASLFVIGFAAGVIALVSSLLDDNRKS